MLFHVEHKTLSKVSEFTYKNTIASIQEAEKLFKSGDKMALIVSCADICGDKERCTYNSNSWKELSRILDLNVCPKGGQKWGYNTSYRQEQASCKTKTILLHIQYFIWPPRTRWSLNLRDKTNSE